MKTSPTEPRDIDQYIAGFPDEVQERLEEIRRTVRTAAPEAKEALKYGMPTFSLNGNLVHFAVFNNHIGFYPAPRGVEELKEELAAYAGAKSSLRLPFDQPLPLDLIRKVVKLRVEGDVRKAAAKRRKG
jgi:uncharacterized protein YdhG (YjbR/CyaY superfamily)